MVFMGLKIKTMDRGSWKRVTEKTYIHSAFSIDEYKGEAGLIKIEKASRPLYVTMDGISLKIADSGFKWLQIGPENQNWWLTVMFNEADEIVQYYFDVTGENIIRSDGSSYFYDMYLDVVLLPDGKIFLLDEDELDEAILTFMIDKNEYSHAYTTAKKIMNYLSDENVRNRLKDFCEDIYRTLNSDSCIE